MKRWELIGQACRSWTLIGWLVVVGSLSSVAGVESKKDSIGLYGSKCRVNSDCQLGFICLYNKCSCRNSYIYDNNKQACRKICRGSSEKLVRHGSFQHQYDLYKQRYTNCTFVDENLEITNLEGSFDLSFLKDIEEVMGYVLIVNVFSNYLHLKNLRIIRGETLYDNYSLYVALNHNPYNDSQGIMELQFVSLSEIVQGQVYFQNNNLMCHSDSIKWEDINPSSIPPVKIIFNSPNYRRQCDPCHMNCYNSHTGDYHCWGSGPDMCQKLNHVKEVCHETCDGRCFGDQQNECCHPECAAGCDGPRKTQCYACRHFYNEGQCDNFCPQMQVYDKKNMKWVANPKGRYSFGTLCVKDCPSYMLKNQGACVIACPPGTRSDLDNNVCIPEESACTGPCPKNCKGISDEERFLHSGNIQRFENCTVVEGNLKILKVTFAGDEHLGIEGIKLEDLKLLNSIREITGYLNIQEAPSNITDLAFLNKLEIIRGRHLSDGNSFALVKLGLRYLGLTSLKKISNGHALILMNIDLCYIKELNLTRLFEHKTQRKKAILNMPAEECAAKGSVCHPQCTSDGCWGPGPDMCLACRNVHSERDNKCLSDCTEGFMLYATQEKTCKPCDRLCSEGCYGPGPEQCIKCKMVEVRGDNNSSVCMEECPVPLKPPFLYPDDDRICQQCDPTCAEGCTGPSNAVKLGGCNTCELAINRTLENGSVHCLPLDQEWCPAGFYIQQYRADTNHPLTKKQVCQPCHSLCLRCNSPGTVNCQECRYYRHYSSMRYSNCVEKCPTYTYSSEKECKPCQSQCLMGCTGPNNTHCLECQNFKIMISKENNTFACLEKCPEHLPYLVKDGTKAKPTMTVCADDSHEEVVARKSKNRSEETKKILIIALPTVAGVILLAILLALVAYYVQKRAKAKENTAKLTAIMTGNFEDEPLTPTNVKPDLSQLRLIKESEMRRGGIIGSGAFGTVYKGFWIPEGENVKIPVAIKVLQEGTSSNQNQELLEEARVMASVDHPCCIRILAVCMATQMMLVTQLMPLGCLLDYIKKHKENTGSKALLNWCTQIARGMAYLEERGIVHRDLAARNVLVQSAGQVKITDFGLAKLLDYNEEEYRSAGGKMPIKWLALECIQNRIFTHKSDVWSYGVTVWELFTYGSRPYEHVRARDVPDLLEKGERLPQPAICTIDVYMIMIKCWMLDADSRPSFLELSEEFAKMARDPGRYLVIQGDALKKIPSEEMIDSARLETEAADNAAEGDKLMRLPSYSYDKDDLARHLSVAAEGPEEVVEADEYLQPQPTTPQSADSSAKMPLLSPGASNKEQPQRLIRDKRYGHLENAAARHHDMTPKNRYRGDSINGRYSSDPVKYIKGKPGLDEPDGSVALRGSPPRTSPRQEPVIQLPLDEDDYLQPKSSNPKAYLELENNKDYYLNEKQMPPAPPTPLEQYNDIGTVPSVFENPEYFEGDVDKKPSENNLTNKKVKPKVAPKPKKLADYYNDPDKLVRERRPLLVSDPNSTNCSNSESTI